MKKKTKTVAAYAYAVSAKNILPYVYVYMKRRVAEASRRCSVWSDSGFTLGPIVRIEVPAPRSVK